MSDFYTKKQKKYWCDKCHIFIEYTKQSIEKHNQSKNHINNSSSGSRYDNMKKKFNKYVSDLNFIHNTEQTFLKNKKDTCASQGHEYLGETRQGLRFRRAMQHYK